MASVYDRRMEEIARQRAVDRGEEYTADDSETTGAGWVGCCGWACLLGGVPMLVIYLPGGIGLVLVGLLSLAGKPAIEKTENDMSEAVRGKGVTPYTMGWLIWTGFVGALIIIGAFVVAVAAMLAVRGG